MRKVLSLACLMAATASSGVVRAAEEKKGDPLMQRKVTLAAEILRGLSLADFDAISSNARQMSQLGVLEKWFRASEPDYKMQLDVFQQANKDLMRFAGAKNLDGASVAYIQLSLSCVNCHKQLRR